jgi:predicted small lipoprotein YifL
MTRALLSMITILIVFAMNGCGCEQTGYKELPSPDGRYVAVERETNCGATDPFGTAISLRTPKPRLGIAWLGPSKRVFLADVSLRNTRVEWVDNDHLKIVCTDCEKYGIAERADGWRDVKINFDVGKAGKGVF